MDSSFADKDSLGAERQGGHSALRDSEGQLRLQQFDPSHQKLLSILELSRSFHAIFQGDTSIARYFKVPLMSDTVAERVARLFDEPHPQVIESEDDDRGDGISWIDLIHDHTSEPKLQSDGSYHCRLQKRRALIKISEYDCNLIFSNDLRNLVHIKSHGGDVQAEIDTMKLVRTEILSWNDIALKLVDMNGSILGTLDAKLDELEKPDEPSPAQAESISACYSNETDLQAHSQHEASVREPGAILQKRGRKRRRLSRNLPWTDEELDILPSWFEPRRQLSRKEIVQAFIDDFGHYRSFPAIQAKLYDKGFGHLSNRKKNVRGKQMVPSATVAPLIPRTTVNPETLESSLITNSTACPEEAPCSSPARSSQDGIILNKESVTPEQSPPTHIHVGRSESRAPGNMAEPEHSEACISVPISATETISQCETSSDTGIRPNGVSSTNQPGADESYEENQHVCGPQSACLQIGGKRPSSLESETLFDTRGEALVSQNHTAVTTSPVLSNHGRRSYTEMEFICPPFTATDDQDFTPSRAAGAQPMLCGQMESRGPERSQSEDQENQEELTENLEQDNGQYISQNPLKFVSNHNTVLPEPSRNEIQPEQDTNSTGGSVNPPDNVSPISDCATPESFERTNLDTAWDHLPNQIKILGNSNSNGNLSTPDAQLSSALHLVQQRDDPDEQPMDARQEETQYQESQTCNAGAPVSFAPNFQGASRTNIPGPGQQQAVKQKRKYTPRTKTGCVTCRRRRKKCDEQYPLCNNCIRGGHLCEGYMSQSARRRRERLSRLDTLVPLISRQDCLGISGWHRQTIPLPLDRQSSLIEASWPPRPVVSDRIQPSAQECNPGTSGTRPSLTSWSERSSLGNSHPGYVLNHTVDLDYQNAPQIHGPRKTQPRSDPTTLTHILN